MWSLRNLDYGTEEYNTVMKEVWKQLLVRELGSHNLNFSDCLQLHMRSAGRLRDVCSRNGALFVKVGQHIGSLDYLFPPEYVDTFKVFHSEAPKTPLHQLKKVIEEEVKQPSKQLSKFIYMCL